MEDIGYHLTDNVFYHCKNPTEITRSILLFYLWLMCQREIFGTSGHAENTMLSEEM